MTTFGRDISSYDSNVNYSLYDFIIGKFTESDNFVSPGALDRARATRAAGKVFSAYHFARPGNGAAQADHFLSVEMPRKGDMPGWLDYEVSGLGRKFFDDFCNRYRQRTGYWPGLYTYYSMFKEQGMATWLKPGQRLWMARYGASSPGVPCDIWQYQGGPDLNKAFTPLSQMVIGGAAPAVVSEGDSAVATAVLSDGKVASFAIGVDGYPYFSRDGWGSVVRLSAAARYKAGASLVAWRDGALAAGRDTAGQVVLFHIPNPNAAASGFTVQGMGGVGAGTPGLAVMPDETLRFEVKGVPDGAIYVKELAPTGTSDGWVKTRNGRAL